jgi:hypothetical protein
MSISALANIVGAVPPITRLSPDATGSGVAQQTSSTANAVNSTVLVSNASSGASASITGNGASAAPPPENPLVKILQAAGESIEELLGQENGTSSTDFPGPSVTITLSAQAQKAIAQQNQALVQLQQLTAQLRSSNHDAAGARLTQLLQEFHALQQFGTASARALAALAKEISAAAADLSESGGSDDAIPTADTLSADAGGQAPDDSANAPADDGPTASASSPTAATNSNVPQTAAEVLAAPTQIVTADIPASEEQSATTPGAQDAGSNPPTADPSSGSLDPSPVAAGAAQRQALLNHLEVQAGQNAAQTQAASADKDLLTQAADAVDAIQGIVKQAAEEEREKKGKSGTELDQLAKSVDASAAVVEKAIGQVETSPVSTPPSIGAISSAGVSINITA